MTRTSIASAAAKPSSDLAVSDFRVPSLGLLTAAFAGLMSVGLSACGDEATTAATPEDDAACATPVPDAGELPVDAGKVAMDAGNVGMDAGVNDAATVETDAAATDAGLADGGADAAPQGPTTIREVNGDRTYASMKAECADLGGYIQIHASCSGSNDCAGFSYGDWNPGVYSEHTCAGANGCLGLSCVVLPKDSGKTGEAVLFEGEGLPAGGPQPCWYCHSESAEQPDGTHKIDRTKFKVWVSEGSTRTEQNWLDLSSAAQQAIVAFGKVGVIGAPGEERAVVSMKGYHKLYSRAEVERVVAYLRTLKPVIAVVKSPL